ncbi:hypothetical protein QQM79_03880 [Marinobacteraceae bacterium S3BR75-40.1]
MVVSARTIQRVRNLVLAGLMVTLTGCGAIQNMMYKTTGDVMKGFAKSHTVPYMLASDDLAMSCAMAEATSPLMLSFGRVTDDPDQLAVMMNLSAGACAEERAWEYELAYMRALRNQNPDNAEDAQIAQKRHLQLASERYLRGWNHLKAHYGEPGNGECPDFDEDIDEFIYIGGLLSGLQALNAEIQSTAPVGVPKNIAAKVARATGCLDDDKWWGVPMAMRATVWALMPGAEPEGEDAFERLDTADAKGVEARVRLPHVFHAMAAYNSGDMDMLRDVIRAHAEAIEDEPADPQWRMVDAMGTQVIRSISDRLWTENTGHRTPLGGLGTFWDDKAKPVGEAVDLDGIL